MNGNVWLVAFRVSSPDERIAGERVQNFAQEHARFLSEQYLGIVDGQYLKVEVAAIYTPSTPRERVRECSPGCGCQKEDECGAL